MRGDDETLQIEQVYVVDLVAPNTVNTMPEATLSIERFSMRCTRGSQLSSSRRSDRGSASGTSSTSSMSQASRPGDRRRGMQGRQ
ncbi:MAG TPA: hypothetical protein VIW24_01470 [Aldersonia sp.]